MNTLLAILQIKEDLAKFPRHYKTGIHVVVNVIAKQAGINLDIWFNYFTPRYTLSWLC